jgi:membrane protein DedA with SNARE-associated domain
MPDVLQTFEGWYAAYGYPVLFLGVALENMGVPVPGETAVLVAGFLASPLGGGGFHLAGVLLVAWVAAVSGDNFGYWVGRRLAYPRLKQGQGFFILTPLRFTLMAAYFDRYGAWTVFFGRFVAGLRVLAAPAAGATGMPWPRFFVANACGGFVWAAAISLLGYYFGRHWAEIHHWLGSATWFLVAGVILILAVRHVRQRRRERLE